MSLWWSWWFNSLEQQGISRWGKCKSTICLWLIPTTMVSMGACSSGDTTDWSWAASRCEFDLNLPVIIFYLKIFSFWMHSFNDVSVQFAQVARTDPVIPHLADTVSLRVKWVMVVIRVADVLLTSDTGAHCSPSTHSSREVRNSICRLHAEHVHIWSHRTAWTQVTLACCLLSAPQNALLWISNTITSFQSTHSALTHTQTRA